MNVPAYTVRSGETFRHDCGVPTWHDQGGHVRSGLNYAIRGTFRHDYGVHDRERSGWSGKFRPTPGDPGKVSSTTTACLTGHAQGGLFPGELRWPLFQHRGNRFPMIGGLMNQRLQGRGHFKQRLQT
jgi:hypothetical protein